MTTYQFRRIVFCSFAVSIATLWTRAEDLTTRSGKILKNVEVTELELQVVVFDQQDVGRDATGAHHRIAPRQVHRLLRGSGLR